MSRVVGLRGVFQQSRVPNMRKAVSGNAAQAGVGKVIHLAAAVLLNRTRGHVLGASVAIEARQHLVDKYLVHV